MQTHSDAGALFRKFHAELFGFLRGRVRTEADAQDLLQNIFLKLLQSGAIARVRDFRAYLYRIARTSLAEYYREAARDDREIERWARHAEDGTTGDADGAAASDEPVGVADAEADVDAVAGSLEACLRGFAENLEPGFRDAVIAVDFERQSQKDFARRLGQPYSSVKSRVQEGRRRLRREFLECCRLEVGGVADGRARIEPRPEQGCSSSCS